MTVHRVAHKIYSPVIMRLIAVSPQLASEPTAGREFFDKVAQRAMARDQGHLECDDGKTAAMAINYCERYGLPYRVTASGRPLTYLVERL